MCSYFFETMPWQSFFDLLPGLADHQREEMGQSTKIVHPKQIGLTYNWWITWIVFHELLRFQDQYIVLLSLLKYSLV